MLAGCLVAMTDTVERRFPQLSPDRQRDEVSRGCRIQLDGELVVLDDDWNIQLGVSVGELPVLSLYI